jgi:DNA-binding MurR/RpiR family transcriptional regulator
MEKMTPTKVDTQELTGSLIRIRSSLPGLYAAEQKVGEAILADPEAVLTSSVTELASRAGASEATVVRFCRSLGYRGYQDFKISLARDLVSPIKSLHEELEEDDDPGEVAAKVFRTHIQSLEESLAALDPKVFSRAAGLMAGARRILFIGVGTSAPNVLDANNKFFRLGYDCTAQTDSHLQVMQAALLGPADVVVAVSHSGQTRDPIETVRVAKSRGAKAVAITNAALSPLAKLCDLVLVTASRETRFRMEALASRIAQTTVINALFMACALSDVERTLELREAIEEAVVGKQY